MILSNCEFMDILICACIYDEKKKKKKGIARALVVVMVEAEGNFFGIHWNGIDAVEAIKFRRLQNTSYVP